MIIYLMNHAFPDASGFGRRCLREIEELQKVEEVTVICRSSNEEYPKKMQISDKIKIVRFGARSKVVHEPENYSGNGLYELYRNLDLMIGVIFVLSKTILAHRKERIHLFCVTSPLTIPFFALIISKLFRVETSVVSFHDLEPELAMHIKKLSINHWIVKIEFFLERLVCNNYKVILVTTRGQANRIASRTNLPISKFGIVENTSALAETGSLNFASTNTFNLVYMSALSFEYTLNGLKRILQKLAMHKDILQNFKFTIIGGGEGLVQIQDLIAHYNLSSAVYCTGQIDNPSKFLETADAAIIPWIEDIMTSTMLPTKLFEYLSFGIPVLAPNFGEFTEYLVNNETALLFDSDDDSISKLRSLIKDKSLRERIGKNGLKLYAKKYQPNRLNKRLLQIYKNR